MTQNPFTEDPGSMLTQLQERFLQLPNCSRNLSKCRFTHSGSLGTWVASPTQMPPALCTAASLWGSGGGEFPRDPLCLGFNRKKGTDTYSIFRTPNRKEYSMLQFTSPPFISKLSFHSHPSLGSISPVCGRWRNKQLQVDTTVCLR